jgi:hypothetical protein
MPRCEHRVRLLAGVFLTILAAHAETTLGRLPLSFEPHRGQAGSAA